MKLLLLIAMCFSAGMAMAAEESFVFVPDSKHAPPRFVDIHRGLPGAFTRKELLGEVNASASGKWELGWFTYGENNSRSVCVGLLTTGSLSKLYIDVDRDKSFSHDELVPESQRDSSQWRTTIGAEYVTESNDYDEVERSILIRRSPVTNWIQIATDGVMRGAVGIAGTSTAAVRLDRNANGRWFDPVDRILLDANQDGRVDSIGGRISCGTVCVLDGKRFVLQSDLLGESLDLVELKGVGTVIPKVTLSTPGKISNVSGAIVSASGVRVPIRELDQPVECPVGMYSIESLEFQVGHKGKKFWFRFYGMGNAKDRFDVKVDESSNLEMIGDVQMTFQQATIRNSLENTLTITPRLKTKSGLYLNGCRTGKGEPSIENRLMTASSHDGKVIDNNSTGFS